MGLLAYTIIAVKELELSRALMGFSSGLLGVILGFYFNRERLEAESRKREHLSRQADGLYSSYLELRAFVDSLTRAIEEEPEE